MASNTNDCRALTLLRGAVLMDGRTRPRPRMTPRPDAQSKPNNDRTSGVNLSVAAMGVNHAGRGDESPRIWSGGR